MMVFLIEPDDKANNFLDYDNESLVGRCLIGRLGRDTTCSLNIDISYRRLTVSYNRSIKENYDLSNIKQNLSTTQKLNNNMNCKKSI